MTTPMDWQTTPYLLVLFASAMISFLWALYGVTILRNDARRRFVLSFVVLCFAVSVWSAVYAIQLALPSLDAKLVAYKFLHIGGAMVPPAWLAFSVAYTGRSHWLTPRTIAGLVAIPIALLVSLPTNPFSIALTDATVVTSGSLAVLVTGNGPLYMLHLAYGYLAIVGGAGLIAHHALRSPSRIRRQSVFLVVGALIPLVLNIFNILSLPPFGDIGVNLTPVSLALSTVLFGVAVGRYRMLDLTPIARDIVVDQMRDGVIVLDEHERVIDLNPAAEALLESNESVLGTHVSSLLPLTDEVIKDTSSLVSLGGSNGDERVLRVTRSSLAIGGETAGWVIVTQDATALERQRRTLERQNERLDQFAQIVSHDLRNPLSVIAGSVTLAAETGEQRHLDRIGDAVDRMDTFLDELLHLSQQGDTITERGPVSLTAVVNAVTTDIGDDQIEINVTTDAVVQADENRLRQVLDNLIRNARDHNEDPVTVEVGALPDGFYIEDDGTGIPVELREDVFDVGYSTRSEGSGFGLTIIHDIIEAHGWSITVTEGTSGGARFEITGVGYGENE